MKTTGKVTALFHFLQAKQRSGTQFTTEEILAATGWKLSTFKTYLGKGQLSDFISQCLNGKYEATTCSHLSLTEFMKLISQSKHRRALGHHCCSKLAKALIRKSRDNMLLALELYNRPSIENRMDSFVMCFCAAWEQLLKAVLIEKEGSENVIFKAQRPSQLVTVPRLRKTLSLRECLQKVFPENSKVRINIERIVTLRDQAVHLLMPELEGISSRIFQSGILNFSSYFEKVTEVSFLKHTRAGMISLIGAVATPPFSILQNIYGDIAQDILDLATTLQDEVHKNSDIEFAVPLNVKLVFATSDDEGNTITLARADEGVESLKKALIIEKTTDRGKTHPYLQSSAITRINEKLYADYDRSVLDNYLVATDKFGQKKLINKHCFKAVLWKNSWDSADNKFHYHNRHPNYHCYAAELVDEFIRKIFSNQNYLAEAKRNYNLKKW